MKNVFKNLTFVLFGFGFLLLVGCNTDENNDPSADTFSSEDSARAAKTDNIVEGALNIMEQAFVEKELEAKSAGGFSLFPECTVITVGTQGNQLTILLDFGNFCVLNNGSVVSGKIAMVYGPLLSGTYTVTYSFEEFIYNGNGVSGGGEIFYEIANQNGNPQSTVNESITVSFPNTTVTGTRNGMRTSEWVEGVGSGTWLDNVYHITGNWDTNFTNGFQRSGEVTSTIVRKLSCLYLVSGRLEVSQDGLNAAIDFGDGKCDNKAIIILNGHEFPIIMI